MAGLLSGPNHLNRLISLTIWTRDASTQAQALAGDQTPYPQLTQRGLFCFTWPLKHHRLIHVS